MPIINAEKIHERNIYYSNFKSGSSNSAPKVNHGYCKLNISVTLKTYDDKKQFYYVDYVWEFKPWGEWDDINILLNNGKLLTWDTLIEMEEKLVNGKKSSPILQKIRDLKALCPFYNNDEFIEDSFNGDIIAKNDMTEQIVRTLCMSNEEIKKIAGNTHHDDYRKSIMNMITYLWD